MGVWKILRAAADAAGITRRVSPAVLRHSFASHLLEGGAPLQDVQLLLGHARITTTQVYARRSDHRLLEVHRSYHPRP
ncbi:MAG: tyrosine-type recombinase/integrase [Gemmatimonadetes bacterium]|nr:tyrosine-type recombinase/integrase [Gemmatimonadota bacterium]